MWKVLIADDEIRIRNGLKELIESFSMLDVEICGMASNGKMALDMVLELKPDILLADISMPKLNGMEMLTQIQEAVEAPEVIIITGYDEFDFAKTAIELGVSDYLLKPINEENLYQALKKVIDKKSCSKRNERLQELLENQLKKNQSYLQKKFFKDWIEEGEDISPIELQEQMNILSIEFPQKSLVIVVRANFHSINENDVSEKLIMYTLENAMESILMDYKPFYVFTDKYQNITGVIKYGEKSLDQIKHDCENAISSLVMNECSVLCSTCTKDNFVETVRNLRTVLQKESSYHTLVKQAKTYIMNNFSNNNLDLVIVSDNVGCNPAYLSRLMKQEIGLSFKEFLSNLRIQKALEMIHDDTYSINQIAWGVGYSNQHYFSTAFKNIMGMSPSEYRKNLKDNERSTEK